MPPIVPGAPAAAAPATGATSASLSSLLIHASRVLRSVQEGHTPGVALAKVPAALRAGSQALAYTSLRRLGTAAWLRQQLVKRAPPRDVDALLHVALALASQPQAQDRATATPADAPAYAPHTLVDQAVQATRSLQPQSADFVNAVLRRYLRERAQWDARAAADACARWNHPAWWIDALRQDWPHEHEVLLEQARRAPPMTLRCNLRAASADAHRQALQAAGLHAERPPWSRATPAMLTLQRPCPVDKLPGFDKGALVVQDAAAQLAAPLVLQDIALGTGARVLDACAAPGGKTAHLLTLDPSLAVTALDVDAKRLVLIHDVLRRAGLQAHLEAADAAALATWWDGTPFDAVLLDAPCTASGIVRRHPDIPWLRRPTDIAALAATQRQLLDALWTVVKPGGCLVYATCSIFKAEGQSQIDAFLQRTPGPRPVLDGASPGHVLPLPDNDPHATAAHDGFFYARMTKPVA
jgi:16S rRNA (cytosine967-C5)-methyltransferase